MPNYLFLVAMWCLTMPQLFIFYFNGQRSQKFNTTIDTDSVKMPDGLAESIMPIWWQWEYRSMSCMPKLMPSTMPPPLAFNRGMFWLCSWLCYHIIFVLMLVEEREFDTTLSWRCDRDHHYHHPYELLVTTIDFFHQSLIRMNEK